MGFFFDHSTLMAGISRTTCATEKSCTSLESPNIQLSESISTKGVALLISPSRHFEQNSTVFIQVGVAALLEEPYPLSIEFLKAEY